ncbi:MAG: tetratricopeptide repeat protein [Bacteroidales bacterium]|nr:tetratricopeptide repeat protein [Bacteroidales bacterium]
MKKIRSYFILLLAAAFMTSCSGLNKMKTNADQVKYDVNPKVLETHAGTVDITIKGTFPAKYFDKHTVLEATPVLTYEGGETAFEKVTVQGESVQANDKVIKLDGGNFTYNGSIPYTKEMMESELILKVNAERKGTSLDFDPIKLADGVIATPTLVAKTPAPIMMMDKSKRIIPEDKVADIHYLINRANIRNSELKAEDIDILKEYLKMVNEDDRMEFTQMVVSAYASPDGELDFNEELSGKRAVSAEKYIKREFDKAEIEDVNKEGFVSSKITAEDWEGFKNEVAGSSMEDKDLILRVLSMYSDPVVREREIKNIAVAFEVLKDDILPKLRRSKLVVNVNKIGFSDDEILAQIKADPTQLNIEELLYAATLTEDVEEQLKYYQIAADQVPKCIRAHNNVGYASMKLGKIDEAKAAFEKAQAIKNNDVVKNNLGYVALLQGDCEKAEEYFTSLTTSTKESNSGLGIIAIKKGEYDKAVNYFGNEPDFNNALALTLKGDLSKAKGMLEGLDQKCHKVAYLKAVIGAKMDDKDYAINNLRAAIELKSDWKAYAASDAEFAKYAADEAFIALVQ